MHPLPPEGTASIREYIVGPWPRPNACVHRIEFDDGLLTVEIGVDGGDRVRATLVRGKGLMSAQITSGRVVCVDRMSFLSVIVCWTEDKDSLHCYLGDRLAASASEPLLYCATFVCRAIKAETIDQIDFSAKNAKALSSRARRWLPRLKQKAGSRYGGPGYIFESLAEEVYQLRDLLGLVRQGHHAHVRGIAAKLRLFLHKEGQMPLLQVCAAILNCELIVFCSNCPDYRRSAKSTLDTLGNVSASLTDMLSNPIDIDVWLGLPSLHIGRNDLSNEKIIADLGNTVGNHLEPNILPSVDGLRSYQTGFDDGLVSRLITYVVEVADVTVALGEGLLRVAQSGDIFRS